jgi:hypothetical protein
MVELLIDLSPVCKASGLGFKHLYLVAYRIANPFCPPCNKTATHNPPSDPRYNHVTKTEMLKMAKNCATGGTPSDNFLGRVKGKCKSAHGIPNPYQTSL